MKRVVTRRLPGFRFEAESPPLAEWLPRMDVACFVGFAASGPLDVPVAVESAEHFESIFGRDAALAWDERAGRAARAQLAPAVRAFFENGGRRCWIVRVARTEAPAAAAAAGANALNRARANLFPVPSLAACVLDEAGGVGEIVPAFARARSEGSWSDALEVGAALLSRPFQVRSLALADGALEVYQDAPGELSAGDLLRLTFDEGTTLFLFVAGIALAASSPPDARRAVRVSCTTPVWLQAVAPDSPPAGPIEADARLYTFEPDSAGDGEAAAATPATANSLASLHKVRFVSDEGGPARDDGALSVELKVALADAPQPGSVVTVETAEGRLLLVVRETGVAGGAESGAGEAVRLTGPCFRVSRPQEWLTAERIAQAERLTFELRARSRGDYALTLGDLGFAAPHARFWGQLPTDAEVYRVDETAPVNEPTEQLWQPVGVLRFPLAAADTAGVVFLPLAMSSLGEEFLGAARLPGSALERDGLAEFDAGLFLDAELADAGTTTLMPRADYLRYLGTTTRPLRGMHAALSVEEVTLIAAPDAAHRGWSRAAGEPPPPPERSDPLARPEWWTFLDCRKYAGRVPLVRRPLRSQFIACGLRVIERPQLKTASGLSESGTFTLSWEWKPPQDNFSRATFVLEESGSASWAAASVIYRGAAESYTLYGRRAGDYYYRVRAEVEGERAGAAVESSDWSAGVVVRVGAGRGWQTVPEEEYDAGALLAVQRALLRLCAARADLLAVLSLPAHYREDKALEHVESLKTAAGASPYSFGVAPIGAGEAGAFSYGALYHPWLVARDAQELETFRGVAPDGAACGLISARALARGAWIAPANEPLRGAVALTPPVVRRRWLDLQLAQINLIRQEPRGFLALSADTLSDEEELRQISVRRLLILLRRLALRHGSTYVFEPNSPAFRRLVQRGFESVMDQLFARGAFAGRTPAASYQVVTGEELNPRQSVDLGRFIVELRVAPSRPLTFLTIRLVQTGERGFVTEGR